MFFFFSSRRRHTRFSRDWSSDVCSSDLAALVILVELFAPGPAMIATTWPPPVLSEQQLALVAPSSNRIIRVPFVPSAGTIFGTHTFSHESPVAMEQECMSLHSFGLIQANCGKPFLRSVRIWLKGTTFLHRAASVRMSLKYMKGSCFLA